MKFDNTKQAINLNPHRMQLAKEACELLETENKNPENISELFEELAHFYIITKQTAKTTVLDVLQTGQTQVLEPKKTNESDAEVEKVLENYRETVIAYKEKVIEIQAENTRLQAQNGRLADTLSELQYKLDTNTPETYLPNIPNYTLVKDYIVENARKISGDQTKQVSTTETLSIVFSAFANEINPATNAESN